MKTRARRFLARARSVDRLVESLWKRLMPGHGMYRDAATNEHGNARSWGACGASIRIHKTEEALARVMDVSPYHVCVGHDGEHQQPWQHQCPCGFRWAA